MNLDEASGELNPPMTAIAAVTITCQLFRVPGGSESSAVDTPVCFQYYLNRTLIRYLFFLQSYKQAKKNQAGM
jgi:hypothetical protein